MSRDWEVIRAAYPESVDILKFLYSLPSRYLALKVELGKGNRYITFSAYPRRGKKLYVYNVCPYETGYVYFHTRIFGELLGMEGPEWFSRRLTETFGRDIKPGSRDYYYSITLAAMDKHREDMALLVSDVVARLSR